MDHEVIPRPCKICDWLLNSSRDHFGVHQGKNIKVTMEFEVPKTHIYGLHYSLTWSGGFYSRRGKRGALVEKETAHGKDMLL
jgi:hypothetical protein